MKGGAPMVRTPTHFLQCCRQHGGTGVFGDPGAALCDPGPAESRNLGS